MSSHLGSLRNEGGVGCARRDCRRGHGSARVAAEIAGQEKGGEISGKDLEEFKSWSPRC